MSRIYSYFKDILVQVLSENYMFQASEAKRVPK